MDSISPNYYAAGEYATSYVLQGRGFYNVPDDAVAVLSANNNAPLGNRSTMYGEWLFRLTARTADTLTFSQVTPGAHDFNSYLGAILSDDRQIAYWINDTRPLP